MTDVELSAIDPEHIADIKRINSVVLPTRYSPKWYKEILQIGDLAQLAFLEGEPVGAIRCSLEKNEGGDAKDVPLLLSTTYIYIMTVAVLAPYRGYGIGTKLIRHIEDVARTRFIHRLRAHVWTENTEALDWYQSMGFERKLLCKNYYRKLSPTQDAWLLEKAI